MSLVSTFLVLFFTLCHAFINTVHSILRLENMVVFTLPALIASKHVELSALYFRVPVLGSLAMASLKLKIFQLVPIPVCIVHMTEKNETYLVWINLFWRSEWLAYLSLVVFWFFFFSFLFRIHTNLLFLRRDLHCPHVYLSLLVTLEQPTDLIQPNLLSGLPGGVNREYWSW